MANSSKHLKVGQHQPIQMAFSWWDACGPTLQHGWDCIYQAVKGYSFWMKLYLTKLYFLLSLWIMFVLSNCIPWWNATLCCISSVSSLFAIQWRIQRGFRGFAWTPPPSPHFKYPMKMESFGLSETKLFHFHGIYKQNEMKSAKKTPYLYTYEPPFQKSWIRPCHSTDLGVIYWFTLCVLGNFAWLIVMLAMRGFF